MNNNSYVLPQPGLLFGHALPGLSTLLVRDGARPRNEALDAVIRSGDYFVTLATRLESIASELDYDDPAQHALLQLIAELEYAQLGYNIVKK